MRVGTLTKKPEFLVSWAGYDNSHDSWQPEANLAGAKDLLSAFKAQRTATEKEAAKAEAAEKLKALKAQQAKAAKDWIESVQPVVDLFKNRFQLLELSGTRVRSPQQAPIELQDELHAVLRKLDPAYDSKIRSVSQLGRMPMLYEYLHCKKHVLDCTYCFETRFCNDPACKFECAKCAAEGGQQESEEPKGAWDDVPEELMACSNNA